MSSTNVQHICRFSKLPFFDYVEGAIAITRPISQKPLAMLADTNRQILAIEAYLSRRGSSDSGLMRSVRQRLIMCRYADTYTENVEDADSSIESNMLSSNLLSFKF